MKNKILITGLPRSGKTTLLEKILANIPNKKGFLTREIRKDGARTGFEVIAHDGQKQVLSSTDIKSQYKVSKYCVDLEGFEKILPKFFDFSENDFLYLDEIGQMELFSENFKGLVTKYLDSPNPFVGTLSKVYSDDFTDKIKKRSDVVIIEIDAKNREEKYKEIMELLK